MKQEIKFKQTEIGMIPEDWKIKTIGDVFKLTQGLQISSKLRIPIKKNGYIPLLKIIDLSKMKFSEFVKLEDVRDNYLASKEDIIYTRTGQVGLVYTDVEGCVHNNCFKIHYDNKIFDKVFIYYMLKQNRIFRYSNSVAAGSVQKDLNHPAFKSCIIVFPPLPEQKAIAKILSDLESKIETLQKQNEALENMGQLLFNRWFVDFKFPDENGKLYKSNGGEMVESELREIPAGWKIEKLGDYIESVSGCSYTSKGLNESREALVTLKSIGINGFKQEGFKEYTGDYKEKHIVKDGDIVVAHTDLTQNRVILGKPVIVRDLGKYKKMIASMDLSIVKPTKLLNNFYLFYLLSTNTFHGHAQGYSNGTTVIHLGRKAIPEFNFIVPKKNILDKFEIISKDIFDKKRINDVQKQSLTKLCDTLLPKLMSGKVRVK